MEVPLCSTLSAPCELRRSLPPPSASSAGPPQETPGVEELQVALASSYDQAVRGWLDLLYDGRSGSGAAAQPLPDLHHPSGGGSGMLLPVLARGDGNTAAADERWASAQTLQQQLPGGAGQQQQVQQQQAAAAFGPSSSSSSGSYSSNNNSSTSSADGAADAVTDSCLQRLVDVLHFNAFGDAHDDLAAASLAGQPPASLLGLWPEFSLLNHS